jgi:hypothetical protein
MSADPRTRSVAGFLAAASDLLADLAEHLEEATTLLRDLADERDALVAANQLWQSNVEGAIADTGNLPGDLTAWSAIRRLTAERDELRAELDRILDAIGDPVGVDYCTLHDGIRNEDDHWCDFHDDDPEEGPDGEPRQCVLVPLVPMTAVRRIAAAVDGPT